MLFMCFKEVFFFKNGKKLLVGELVWYTYIYMCMGWEFEFWSIFVIEMTSPPAPLRGEG